MNGTPDHAALLAQARRLTGEIEQRRRELVAVWRDVHALGGMPTVTGYTPQEWLELVTRMSGFDAGRLERFATRLPALPCTAVALHEGSITVDQAANIVDATVRLSGDVLAAVDRRAVEWVLDVNGRSDFPDVRDGIDGIVREHRPVSEVERAEARALRGDRCVSQASLTGGGWVFADYTDPTAFATVTAAVEHAAGPPSRDVPRERQRAAGLLAISSSWCAAPDRGSARPAVQVMVDLADATETTAATLQRSRGRRTPRLNARTLETLVCDAELLVQIVDGARPLAVLKDRDELPDKLREVVKRRDRGCRWPGCAAPVWQTDVHHLVHREDGGDHRVDNLLCLCRRHHRMLHGPTWTVQLDGRTGELRLWRGRARRGREPTHTTRPHGRPAVPPSDHRDVCDARSAGDGSNGDDDRGVGRGDDLAGETVELYVIDAPGSPTSTSSGDPPSVIALR